ncbi:glycosyltransferase family 1 protein [Phormidesmis priestleyi ULC007]|uniref:Glycosyltransferase family 1 protein n=2 Tax=Phormidesmis priestleyi TaxID=268141 RepID=A0A2T1DNL9_9CYAN|nr:glycosyltransferase family 4 protein [Phormidesmis priestleyi]PSB22014.1 glycosyltransferase family 1 protein [Phormidesmis priestleyi ULC007]PZO55018.1 MAG: glycosyltransferase family 1 protein [Phormidesmis priestleyi]
MDWFPEQTGGLNRFYYDCTRHLPAAGIKMRGLVTGSDQVFRESHGQIQVFAPQQVSLLKRWQGLRSAVQQVLKEEDLPLVVSHFALYGFPILNLIGDRPLVVHFHGPWALESQVEGYSTVNTWLKKTLEQKYYQRASKLIVLSTAFRDLLHQSYQIPYDRIHVVPPGVDLDRFAFSDSKSEARLKLGWECDRPILFATRRLKKRMGLENLVSAMQTVRQHHPDALLLIAGKGELAETLHQQIESLDLTNHVRLLGFVPDEQLALAYRAADFSVVPTLSLEGFGLIMIESLASGTPVIGTPVGAIPEVLRPLSADLMFEGSSTEHLAQGLLEILSGQRSLPDAEACRAYVRDHYAWSVVAQQIKVVYSSALSDRVPSLAIGASPETKIVY